MKYFRPHWERGSAKISGARPEPWLELFMAEDFSAAVLGEGTAKISAARPELSCSSPRADGLSPLCPMVAAAESSWTPQQSPSRLRGGEQAGTAGYPFQGQNRDSQTLFGLKYESHRGVFSSLIGLSACLFSKPTSNWFFQARETLLAASS